MLDNQATSAKTLTLAAIIVQSALFLFGVSVLLYAQITIKSLPAVFEYTLVGFAIEVVALFVWALLDYLLVFRKIVQGRAGEAEKSSMTLGIIQLLIGGVFAGILLLLAHSRLKKSMANALSG